MNEISLKLNTRTIEGKKVSKLREQGFVPSVIYGDKTQPVSAQSPLIETQKVVSLAGKHTPVNITLDGKKMLAIIKSIDFSPTAHKLRHVAFHKINANDVVTTEVAIELIGMGESPAEKAGLVILQALDTVEIKAKPADLPESIKLSVVKLINPDDRLTVADIVLPKGVSFADVEQDTELVIANVYEPSALQAANEASGGEAEVGDAQEVEATAENDSVDTKSEE